MRLDGLARWLQDVAYADVEDAGVAELAVWVVRRTRILVARFPRFADRCTLQTFCSGVGRMWAERRTTVLLAGTAEPAVEAVSLWVHLDPESWRPCPFSEPELAIYGEAAGGRRVTARLRHPAPPSTIDGGRPWAFRETDTDLAAHVNNAAYWEPLEEELLLAGAEPEQLDVEIEFRNAAQPGPAKVLTDGRHRWIVGADGEPFASIAMA
jgi:acyl-ACP thioesterase